jgi:universal stress protein A
MTVKKILITTDLSGYSLAALEAGTAIASQFGSRVFLLYVMDSAHPLTKAHGVDAETRSGHPRAEDQGRRGLAEFVKQHAGQEIAMTEVVRVGAPVDEIRRFAEEEGVDVIVIATHGWTGLRHILLGSVAEKIVRLSSIPVLTVKPESLRENFLKHEDIEDELHLR